jgi:hypothetical protein
MVLRLKSVEEEKKKKYRILQVRVSRQYVKYMTLLSLSLSLSITTWKEEVLHIIYERTEVGRSVL